MKLQPKLRVMFSMHMPLNAASRWIAMVQLAHQAGDAQATARRDRTRSPREFLRLQRSQDPPGVGRQPVPGQRGGTTEIAQRPAQAVGPIDVEDQLTELSLEVATWVGKQLVALRRCNIRLLERLPQDAIDREQVLVGALVVDEALQRGAHLAHHALGTLGVAAQPEQVVGTVAR